MNVGVPMLWCADPAQKLARCSNRPNRTVSVLCFGSASFVCVCFFQTGYQNAATEASEVGAMVLDAAGEANDLEVVVVVLSQVRRSVCIPCKPVEKIPGLLRRGGCGWAGPS